MAKLFYLCTLCSMSEIKITLPDGSVRNYPQGVNPYEVALSISEGLARNILVAQVNEKLIDTTTPITSDSNLKLIKWEDSEGKSTFWHSTAHLMAEALEALYPCVQFGIGPPIENGFYYDVDMQGAPFTADDLQAVENKMLALAKGNSIYERKEVSKSEAIEYFKQKGDSYKLELLEDLKDGEITFYKQGNFTDLCRGPHIPNTGFIKAIKLTSLAGAYWRGDEKNKQ